MNIKYTIEKSEEIQKYISPIKMEMEIFLLKMIQLLIKAKKLKRYIMDLKKQMI